MFKHPVNKSLLVILFILTLISFSVINLVLLPAFSSFFDFTTDRTANIGTTIGGITTPVLTIFSSYLLYMTLTRQTESNLQQRLKNESDMIFLLINQLDAELGSFYMKQTKGTVVERLTGLEGLNDFARGYRFENNIDQFESMTGFTFKAWYEAGQIAVIVDTFNLIEQRIVLSNLDDKTRSLFQLKLDSYFRGTLIIPFNSLASAFQLYPHQMDPVAQKIIDLVESKGRDEYFYKEID